MAQFDPKGMWIILLKNVPSEFDKYVIDEELHYLCNNFSFPFRVWQNKLIRDPEL